MERKKKLDPTVNSLCVKYVDHVPFFSGSHLIASSSPSPLIGNGRIGEGYLGKEWSSTRAMRYGVIMEPYLQRFFFSVFDMEKMGWKEVKEQSITTTSPKYKLEWNMDHPRAYLSTEPDMILQRKLGEQGQETYWNFAVELKALYSSSAIVDTIPASWYIQCQMHLLLMTKCIKNPGHVMWLFTWSPTEWRLWEIERDDSWQQKLTLYLTSFSTTTPFSTMEWNEIRGEDGGETKWKEMLSEGAKDKSKILFTYNHKASNPRCKFYATHSSPWFSQCILPTHASSSHMALLGTLLNNHQSQ